jgi:uncharacterized repeat protein (TIGR01451 family)
VVNLGKRLLPLFFAGGLGLAAWLVLLLAPIRMTQAGRPAALQGSYKTVSPSVIGAGQPVTFTIVVSNSSPVSDVIAFVNDTLPAPLHNVENAHTAPANRGILTATADGIAWQGAISASQAIRLVFQARSVAVFTDTLVTNTAVVSDVTGAMQVSASVWIDVLGPTARIMWPEDRTVITQSQGATLAAAGVVWDGTTRPSFPVEPVLNPINNANGDGNYYVTWNLVPGALAYTLQEADNALFEGAVNYASVVSPKYITGKAIGWYYYRVRAHNLAGDSRWSNAQAVHVLNLLQVKAEASGPQTALASPAVYVCLEEDGECWGWTPGIVTAQNTWWTWQAVVFLPDTDFVTKTVWAYAVDAVGNIGPTDTITIYIDNRAPTPVIGNLTAGQWISQTYLITGTVGSDRSGGAQVQVSADAGATWAVADSAATWTYSWTLPAVDGGYTVTARAYDGRGNVSVNGLAVPVIVDQPPPAPAGLHTLFIGVDRIRLGWTPVTVSDVLSYTVYWGTDPEGYTAWRDVGLTTTCELTGLQPNRLYHLAVAARDGRSESAWARLAAQTEPVKLYVPVLLKRWPPIPYPPTLRTSAVDAQSLYTLTWVYNYPSISVVSYTLQEATDANFTTGVQYYYPGLDTIRVISKTPGAYYYRVRGHNAFGAGEWSNVVFVLVVSRVPTLTISPLDAQGTYTLTWSSDYPATWVVSYTLQEATDASFAANVRNYYPGANTQAVITGQAAGVYYYRVWGVDEYGPGAYSNVVSITVVRDFIDHFDDPASGWAMRRCDDPTFETVYQAGRLYTLAQGSRDFAVFAPMVPAPSLPYTLSTRARIVDGTIDGKYYESSISTFGVIFGGNAGDPCPADRNTVAGAGCLSHYYRVIFEWGTVKPNRTDWSIKRIDYHGDRGSGVGVSLAAGDVAGLKLFDWNEIKIAVTQSGFAVYVWAEDKYKLLHQTRDTTYVNEPYFGIFIATREASNIGYAWDWYKLER